MTSASSEPGRSRRPITGRALVLGAVIVALVVLLAPPLHRYLTARSNLSQSLRQQHQDQQELKQLQAQDKQLSDPAYIAALARDRLQYALPGETVYTIVRPGDSQGVDSTQVKASQPTKAPGDTWNERLWGSAETAGGS